MKMNLKNITKKNSLILWSEVLLMFHFTKMIAKKNPII